MFDGEISIRTLLKTLIQIFCEIILYSKIIVESIRDPDHTLLRNP